MAPSAEFPTQVTAAHPRWTVDLAWTGELGKTWRLTSPDGEVRYAKVRPSGGHPPLSSERDRLGWASRWVNVPKVVEHVDDGEIEWLVTTELEGADATIVKQDADHPWLVRTLGAALRVWHETLPVDECPFDFRLDAALELSRRRVAASAQVSWDGLRGWREEMTPLDSLAELERTRPADEDLVVCHGDYCFPNIFLMNGRVTGFLDLGDLAVADRWWDIAIGAWSTTWNVDPALEPLFYEGYGIEPDPERIRYYRLLYEVA